MVTFVYKILPMAEWTGAVGIVPWSNDDRRDGFMHLSTAEQVLETAARHFAGRRDLVALEINAARLGTALRYERGRGGDLFPHLYGELDAAAVTAVRPLVVAEERFRFADAGQ